MKLFNLRFLAAVFLFSSACSSYAQSADTTATAPVSATTSAPAASNSDSLIDRSMNWIENDYQDAEKTVENLYDNGRLSLVFSGYAHHGRGTYSPEQIDELNEKVWGFGVSKELRDAKDNEESINFVIMADSHYTPQLTASYTYQWMKPLSQNWELGGGYMAGLISRTDILDGAPFPGVLPVVSIGTHDTKLVATYIPRLSGTGNGDVLFLALRIAVK